MFTPLNGMLSSFLFTPKQQRLLAAILLHPEREYTLAALQDATSGGVSSLVSYIDTLINAGVVLVRKVRASKMYRANIEHPLYPELKSIAVKSFGILDPIRLALASVQDTIQRAFIFGSIVKGNSTHTSDIDLMVVGTISTGKLRIALSAAEASVGRPIHINVYDPEEFDDLRKSDPVIKSILEGPKLELYKQYAADPGNDESIQQLGQHPVSMESSSTI
jgi:predicted nucleotidyltransferase